MDLVRFRKLEPGDQTMHVFERARLGKAPYTFLGVTEKRGPLLMPDGFTTIGAPGQPLGSCRFCGTPIAYCFNLRSADGKYFHVGSDCIRKSGDNGLRKVVTAHEAVKRRELNDKKREARHKREAEQRPVVSAQIRAHIEANRDALTNERHPMIEGKSQLDYLQFLLDHAGTARLMQLGRELQQRGVIA